MRLFYAALFDEGTLAGIEKLQSDARSCLSGGRRIPRNHFHMTLHFLGEKPETKAAVFIDHLEQACRTIKPAGVDFPGFGTFPRRGEHLVYLKVREVRPPEGGKEEPGSLEKIAELLKRFSGEGALKNFKTHVTLFRRVLISGTNLQKLKSPQRIINSPQTPAPIIHKAALMESRRIHGKIEYTPLHIITLKD